MRSILSGRRRDIWHGIGEERRPDALLPSIEICCDRNHVIYAIAWRAYDYASRTFSYVYIRRNSYVAQQHRADDGWWERSVVRAEPRGGGKGGRGGNEGNDRMEKKLGTIGMLIRFARSLSSFVLFCECRSSADGGRWNAFLVPRGREDKGAQEHARAEDCEYSSFTISAGSVTHKRSGISALRFFVIRVCAHDRQFLRGGDRLRPIRMAKRASRIRSGVTLNGHTTRFG